MSLLLWLTSSFWYQRQQIPSGPSSVQPITISEFKQAHPLTFSDSFNTGSLDANVWVISTGASPSSAGEANGQFAANSISLAAGCLQLRLTQNSSASLGGEISSVASYGYGLYEFTMRMGSTSTTPTGAGNSVSGGVSAGFNFINASETEIDFELEGQFPHNIETNSWTTTTEEMSSALFGRLSAGFHKYSFLWLPTSIAFYVDGLQTHAHTTALPTTAAKIFLNHWGTDSASFGGLKTTGVSRYLYCTNVSYFAS